jgi:large subunit ribosomal protein L6
MSRIASKAIEVPQAVNIKLDGNYVQVSKGSNTLEYSFPATVKIDFDQNQNQIKVKAVNNSKHAVALSGTTRSFINNMIKGLDQGFTRRLNLVGVGYRVRVNGNQLNMNLGFSHQITYQLPEGVTAEAPTPTELVLKSADNQLVGQVASEIRAYRPPEPYKGKGVRYENERILYKEAKKK